LPKVTGPTLAGTAQPSSAKYTALNGGGTDGTYWYAVVSEHAKSGTKTYDSTQLIKTKLYASSPTKIATFRIRSGNHGRTTALRKNAFTRAGYTFTGWTAKRSYDNKTRYQNPKDTSKTGWYAAGHQPSGWKPYLYKNGSTVLHTTPRGAVALTAVWRAA